ncbi:MAG: glucan 1,4-alpha-glucosidase [Acidobacteria bacterium]|nr:glucan 1,4-alpha-glucosidase [Acidobacteriota bacterium]
MPDSRENFAPGWPGIEARWTSSAKTGVGTALNRNSRVWFTLSHGILDEVYCPRIDQACLRDLGLIVTGPEGFFSEEKRSTMSQVEMLGEGVPAYRLTNTCNQGAYRIRKTVICDPDRPTVLQHVRFEALKGQAGDFRLYVIAAPHLYNRGMGNTAWTGDYKGVPLLFASRDRRALALGCSAGWMARSVGFVGQSDGWQDLSDNRRLTWFYTRAENGNVAVTGELDIAAAAAEGVVLALAFGDVPEEAGQRARASLAVDFKDACKRYSEEWAEWQQRFPFPYGEAFDPLARTSVAVLRTHEDKSFPGGIIASLSIPWGMAKGDDDLGGYHLIWPRDVVETAGGLLAAGANNTALRVFEYLESTQEADGHWPQNQWLDGSAYWRGIQMDETSFPILLLDLLRREHVLEGRAVLRYHEMVRAAAAYLVQYGPVTDQDRWEEDPGYSPFTLAAEIAALLAAADIEDVAGYPGRAQFLRETADIWNQGIERWTYVTGTELAERHGVEGYYVRIGEPDDPEAASPMQGYVPIKNRAPGETSRLASDIVSPDFLALVRFGLRDAHDPRILNTLKVVDALLKTELPQGPGWHRYNGDGYGEHDDGSPFDGTGIGRVWPLLTGERAHYEIAAGNYGEAMRLRGAFAAAAEGSGLLPEQVWDAPDLPQLELFFGKASGSARPLAWAHAEYLKLCRSLHERRVFDQPEQTTRRYLIDGVTTDLQAWRFNNKCRTLQPGRRLRIALPAPATIHWSTDNWKTSSDLPTRDSGFSLHYADLPTAQMPPGTTLAFTFLWTEARNWEGQNYEVVVG